MPELRVKGTNIADYDLLCYAPGDGGLAFSWVNNKTKHADSYLIVTREDVDAYLASEKGKKHHGKYKVFTINGQLRLAQPVTRTGPNTLELDGSTYQYTLTEEGTQMLAENKGHLPHSYVGFTFDHEGKACELKNWSMLATLTFFLVHEKILTA